MAQKRKRFELYSTALQDGRRVVRVVSFGPAPATLSLVAASKREALDRARKLRVEDPHIDSASRPLSIGVDLASVDPDGGVFWKKHYGSTTNQLKYFPLRELSAYLADPERLA